MSVATIRDAMTDPALFGGTFGGGSFAAWRALLAGFYGLSLDDTEAATFCTLTGFTETPAEEHHELWLVVGRRGGKSHAAALLATFEAAFKDHRDKLAAGEWATVLLIAADRPQARTLLRYVRGMFEHPMLKPLVQRETAEGLELRHRCSIEVGTASFRSVRGYTLAAVICDELAFWMTDGARPDVEVIAALRPALATLDGPLVALSSPYARRGMLWDTYQTAFRN
jgi:phage terminase large subunit-like protein